MSIVLFKIAAYLRGCTIICCCSQDCYVSRVIGFLCEKVCCRCCVCVLALIMPNVLIVYMFAVCILHTHAHKRALINVQIILFSSYMYRVYVYYFCVHCWPIICVGCRRGSSIDCCPSCGHISKNKQL